MKALFEGWPHGTLLLDPAKLMPRASDGKRASQRAYQTVERGRTDADFDRHRRGEVGLGISPLRDDDTCVFGAIDIDIYNAPAEVETAIIKALRVTTGALFRSKSRGFQFYAFASEPVPATLMVAYLEQARRRLPKKVREKSKEIFPKQTRTDNLDKAPSAINLPLFGDQRECVAIFAKSGRIGTAHELIEPELVIRLIKENCRLTRDVFEQIAERQDTYVDRSSAGYREPTDAAGRQDHLWRVGCSMQARGWEDAEIYPELDRLNRAHAEAGHPAWGNKGPLDDRRLREMLKRIFALPKGAPPDLHFREIDRFNEDYAVLVLNGKVEYLDLKADDFVTYTWGDLRMKTAPRRVRLGKSVVPVAQCWLTDPDRKELTGVVTEPLSYNGPAYNRWEGFAVEPMDGDASLFFDGYLLGNICDGDASLNNWIVQWLADAVQRPTEPSVPSALAMRGPQGQGKTYLLTMLARIFGLRNCEIVHESERLFSRFNRGMFGKTIIGCEESIFTGDKAAANKLKAFIASDSWTYEEKFKQSFAAKNVHRIIANTNSEQAVHLDRDDRRWTIVEVPHRWDMTTEEGRAKSYSDWQPLLDFRDGDGPRLVLQRLLNTKVDRSLITFGHGTKAKARDKILSNPVLALLDEIAETGVAPHDRAGVGVVSSKSFVQAVKAKGGAGTRYETPESIMAEFDRLLPDCEVVRNAAFVENVKMATDQHGCSSIAYQIEGRQRGRSLGSLSDFRERVSCITMTEYGCADSQDWGEWEQVANGFPASDEEMPF